MTYIKPLENSPYNPQRQITPQPIWNIPGPTKQRPAFKAKRAGTKTAHVVFILDESSSMNACWDETISGFNEFLDTQRSSEIETFVTLYKFNGHNTTVVHDHVPVKDVEDLTRKTYSPSGMTNLHDSMGLAMSRVNADLAQVKKAKRDSVTIVALTDGFENSSREYDANAIREMVSTAEAKDWSFMFLGANIDAFATGSALGFRKENTLQYDTSNMGSTMAAASRMTRDMSVAKSAGLSAVQAYAGAELTPTERDEANK